MGRRSSGLPVAVTVGNGESGPRAACGTRGLQAVSAAWPPRQSEPVGEKQARFLLRRHAATSFAHIGTVVTRQRLKMPGRLVQPGPYKARTTRATRLLSAGPVTVAIASNAGGRTASLRRCMPRQPLRGLHRRVRSGRGPPSVPADRGPSPAGFLPTPPRPNPGEAYVRFPTPTRSAGIVVRKLDRCLQITAKARFLLGIRRRRRDSSTNRVWPGRGAVRRFLDRRGAVRRNAANASHFPPPCSRASPARCGPSCSGSGRIPACRPCGRRPSGASLRAETGRIAHPKQQIADRVADREPVELIGLQKPALKRGGRLAGQQRQGPQQGLRVAGSAPRRGPIRVRNQERLDGPVPAIPLMPQRPPILQLDKGRDGLGNRRLRNCCRSTLGK